MSQSMLMRGFFTAVLSVSAPGELRLPKVCCVGLSCQATLPIHNPTHRWLQAHVSLSSITVNGQHHDPSVLNPFHHRLKVIIEPNASSDLQVCVYVVQLIIILRYIGVKCFSLMHCVTDHIFSKTGWYLCSRASAVCRSSIRPAL